MNTIRCLLLVTVGSAGLLLALAGIGLVLAPHGTLGIFARLAAYSPVARALRWFEERHFIERFVYRHHRLFGAAVTLGALYSSYRLLSPAAPAPLSAYSGHILLLTALRFLWMANTLLIVVGMVIFLRPSLLKGVEQWGNRRIALESPNSRGGNPRLRDRIAVAPRTSGMILAIAGSYLSSLMLIG